MVVFLLNYDKKMLHTSQRATSQWRRKKRGARKRAEA
jgi:hypothetical protein